MVIRCLSDNGIMATVCSGIAVNIGLPNSTLCHYLALAVDLFCKYY